VPATYGYISESTVDSGSVYAPFKVQIDPSKGDKAIDLSNDPTVYPSFDMTTSGYDNHIVKTMVDNGGKVWVVGVATSLTGYQAEWTQTGVHYDPKDPKAVRDEARWYYGYATEYSLYIACYNPNGELSAYMNGDQTMVPNRGVNYYANQGKGTYDLGNLGKTGSPDFRGGLLAALGNQYAAFSTALNDYAVTAAIDPTDGSVVVIFESSAGWTMARYSPSTLGCMGMTPLNYAGSVNDIRMLNDGSFILIGGNVETATTGIDAVGAYF
jgi:hypothetical protein